MKKLFYLILPVAALACSVPASAQDKYGATPEQSQQCKLYLSYYQEDYKIFKRDQKNEQALADVLRHWHQAFATCPVTANQTMLVDGTALYRKLIGKASKNVLLKEAYVDTLMMLHDLRIENYPKYAVTARNNKGLDMANYVKNDDRKLYDGYNAIIEANKAATKPNILLFDLNAAINLFKVGVLTEEDILDVYERNASLLDQAVPANDTEAEMIAKTRTDLGNLFVSSKVASCEAVLKLFTPRFEANPSDGELAGKIVKIMASTEDCTDNKLFLDAATAMYNTNPTAASAYFLYKINSQNGKEEAAVSYLEKAVAAADSDAAQDAEYLYELAAYCYKTGRTQKAVDCCDKSIATDVAKTYTGKCYFLLGTIWAATKCKGDEISTRAPFWVAVDYMQKAKTADPSLTEEAAKLIAQYSTYFPQTAEAFMYDVQDGQIYEVSCGGMRAKTIVRTQK